MHQENVHSGLAGMGKDSGTIGLESNLTFNTYQDYLSVCVCTYVCMYVCVMNVCMYVQGNFHSIYIWTELQSGRVYVSSLLLEECNDKLFS